jgi:hypothetical protein
MPASLFVKHYIHPHIPIRIHLQEPVVGVQELVAGGIDTCTRCICYMAGSVG